MYDKAFVHRRRASRVNVYRLEAIAIDVSMESEYEHLVSQIF